MNINVTPDDLRPLVETVVAETLAAFETTGATLSSGRMAYTEAEAAQLLGVKRHVLRDARIRSEIVATRIGGRIGYEPAQLRAYLIRNRVEGRR